MKVLCVLTRYAYGDPARGENYDYVHFVPAFKSLGHQVEVFDSGARAQYADFSELNAALLAKVDSFQPDLIFTVLMHYEVWMETLDLIRARRGVPIVNWGTDDSWKFRQATRFFARHVDLHVTTDVGTVEQAAALGLDNVVLSQWAASSDQLAEPLPSAECTCDVSFVGSVYGDRARWIAALRSAGIDVKSFGHGSEHGVVASEDIPNIYRMSRIALNFTGAGDGLPLVGSPSPGQIKARTFEVPGAGGFLLTQTAPGLERYFRAGEEIAVFRTEAELLEQIRYYLANPEARDRVARAGHRRTAEHHTYPMRFTEILDHVAQMQPDRQHAVTPAEVSATAHHRTGFLLRALRGALVSVFSLVFGPKRGPRAARRLMYEASWRLAGETTYRASGWPGRLFYGES